MSGAEARRRGEAGLRGAVRADQVDAGPDDPMGRGATRPSHIPWRGWRAVIARTAREMVSDRVSLVAAGCAFWGTLALFPGLSMLVAIYGLMFDPQTVVPQLEVLRDLLPPTVFELLSERLRMLVSHPANSLQLNVAISAAVAFWSATTGTKSLLAALNLAYEEAERRSYIRYQLVSLGMTLAAMLGAVVGISLMVFLPAMLDFVGIAAHRRFLVTAGSDAVLVAFVLTSLSVLYRFGPSRRTARWSWITPGSIVATVLWLAASWLFSWYVGNIARYDALYGPLGAVAGILMWFWVTAYVVLLGAELNSELELQTAADTTSGRERPAGQRGAFVADHVANP